VSPLGDDLMKTSGLREVLQSAFTEFFARNVGANGSRSYYGVAVSNVRKSGTEIALDLKLTFKRGKRYCCFEDGCHHGLYSKAGWVRLRRLLPKEVATELGPIRVGILLGRVEARARANYGGILDRSREVVRKAYRYRAGPYSEMNASEF
jgi:hypothetical protein